jgi:hypothetical protein
MLAVALALIVLAAVTSVPPAHDSPVVVGISFSPERALASGLDVHASFQRLEAMGFGVIRLSIAWDSVDAAGYGRVDQLVADAEQTGQPLILAIGMKAPGWPEFHVPPRFAGTSPDNGALRAAALAYLGRMVERYRDVPAILAWQVENEPLDAAGPRRWRIGPDFVRQEIARVRSLDPRPIVLTAFGPLRRTCSHVSSLDGCDAGALAGTDTVGALPTLLGMLGADDVLGLDVYTGVGRSRAADCWPSRAAGWRALAAGAGRRAWVTELQAEPWEPTSATLDRPLSISPAAIGAEFATLRRLGYRTILLWGSEYWLRRDGQGDDRWLRAVSGLLRQQFEARVPPTGRSRSIGGPRCARASSP